MPILLLKSFVNLKYEGQCYAQNYIEIFFSKTFKMTNFKARDVQYLVLPSYFPTEENDAL